MAKSWSGSTINRPRIAALSLSLLIAPCLAAAVGAQTPAVLPDQQAADRALDVYAVPGRLVLLPDGRKMNIYCVGNGSPTIVLETGLDSGGTMDWRSVQGQMAKKTRTCSYDRAGYAFSDPGPLPRDPSHIAADLHGLLGNAGERAPFLLVGHSMGGIYVRAFARAYPAQVAGMVLVDSSSAGQNDAAPAGKSDQTRFLSTLRDCLQQARVQSIRPGTACMAAPPANSSSALKAALYKNTARLSAFQTLMSEYQGFLALPPATDQTRLGSIPLTVLYVHHPELKDADAIWADLQKQLATLSDKGSAKLVAGSGHFIEIDKPEVLIAAVDDMVDQLRAETTRH
jgi:pimeloyl-ACP methyl ester carboxylesterase